ncbi:MAG: hypothetical protein ACRD3P_01025 [Terriglobales bacterium]
MKARRADFHLQSAEAQLRNWINGKPYTITEKDDFDRTQHVFIITPHPSPEEIALAVGDFVNCLRSCLDQLAWNLVNLFPETVPFNEKAAMQVVFPITRSDETYGQKQAMFHPSIHKTLDSLQPSDRANAIYTHHLWQLDKLWNIDKHRTIPVNCGNWTVNLMPPGTIGLIEYDTFKQCIYAVVPSLARFYSRPPYVKPQVIPAILFGEYMGKFDVSITRLREIHTFVVREVIPKFTGFFPSIPIP